MRKSSATVADDDFSNWQGEAITLPVDQTATMPATPAGSMMFAFQNMATMNNAGQLTLTSGGGMPEYFVSPALLQQPNVLIRNWQGNNLNITNTSNNPKTPIWMEAFGPGLGPTPGTLPINQPTAIAVEQALQGQTPPTYMQLLFQFDTSDLALFGVIGGPADQTGNNAYAIALNSSSGNTGPGTPNPAPPGYYATSGGNKYTFSLPWRATSIIYVAYFSSGQIVVKTAREVLPVVTLRSL